MTRVLFVCLGNICRSPAAEGVFRDLAGDAGLYVQTDSAGTSGWHIGDPPYGPMQEAVRAAGHDISDLRARAFEPADFTRFDWIIAMDGANLAAIEAQRPAGNETPVKLFLEFAGQPDAEVPDPYYTRDFEGALALITAASAGLVQILQ